MIKYYTGENVGLLVEERAGEDSAISIDALETLLFEESYVRLVLPSATYKMTACRVRGRIPRRRWRG